MADDKPEIRVRLVADDLTEGVVRGVREGMEGVAKATEKAKDAAGEKGFAGELIKGLIGFEGIKAAAELVTEGVHQAYEMTEKLADAAMEVTDEMVEQQRAMTGGLMLMDQGNHSMMALRDYAAETREEFADFAISAGVGTKAITDAYNELTSSGNMASEKAKDLAESMAIVGKVVPGGIGSLATGFSMMEMGMVRARNPVVQLIAATHTLKGNAHAVAAAMQKMTPEKQMEIAEKAIAAQAKAMDKMGGLGAPTMPELKESFEGVKEKFLESMGQPMEDALIPHLVALKTFLQAHIAQITAFGEKAGHAIGEVIDYVSDVVEGLYEGFQQDWGEIKSTFDELFGDWYRAWEEASKDAGGIRKEFKGMADDFVLIMKPILAAIKATAEVAMDANDVLHGRAAGTTQMQIQAGSAANEAKNATEGGKSMAQVDLAIQKYRQLAAETGVNAAAADDYAQRLHAMAEANMHAAEQAKDAVESGNIGAFDDYVNSAVAVSSEGAEDFAFHLLEESKGAREAFLAGKDHIAIGMDALMKVIHDRAPELEEMLKAMSPDHIGPKGTTPPPQHQMIFNGASFNIKQDFKDSDPDRIAIAFKGAINKAATNRIESRYSTAFGV